jgi:hypothetical protein
MPLPPDSLHVDELRYLFLVSQVEVLDSARTPEGANIQQRVRCLGIGVVDADGEKCDRCWNYSTQVGDNSDHPTICDRCVEALGESSKSSHKHKEAVPFCRVCSRFSYNDSAYNSAVDGDPLTHSYDSSPNLGTKGQRLHPAYLGENV